MGGSVLPRPRSYRAFTLVAHVTWLHRIKSVLFFSRCSYLRGSSQTTERLNGRKGATCADVMYHPDWTLRYVHTTVHIIEILSWTQAAAGLTRAAAGTDEHVVQLYTGRIASRFQALGRAGVRPFEQQSSSALRGMTAEPWGGCWCELPATKYLGGQPGRQLSNCQITTPVNFKVHARPSLAAGKSDVSKCIWSQLSQWRLCGRSAQNGQR
jgi:hypothetical protein